MRHIADYVAAVESTFSSVGADLNTIVTGVATLNNNLSDLRAKLADSGNLSDADTAALDQVLQDGATLLSNADSIAKGFAPPVAPVIPPPATEAGQQPGDSTQGGTTAGQ